MIRFAPRLLIPGKPVRSSSPASFRSSVFLVPLSQPSFAPSTAAFTARPASSTTGFASAAAFAASSWIFLSRSAESSLQPATAQAAANVSPSPNAPKDRRMFIESLLLLPIFYVPPLSVYPQFLVLPFFSLPRTIPTSLLLLFQKCALL